MNCSSLCVVFIIIFEMYIQVIFLDKINGERDHPIILLPNLATDHTIVQIENHKLRSELFVRGRIARQNNSDGGSPC